MLLTAVGVGLLAGAGQLGFAYGLGIVRFARSFDGAAVNQWPAQLAWVSWFAMVAAVAGAVVAERLARRRRLPVSTASRIAMAVAAGFGAAAIAPLSMQPARAAQAVASVNPVLVAGTAAAGGALVGIVAALAALNLRPFGWNLAAVTGGAWFLALISVMPSLGPDDPLPAVRLGVFDPSSSGPGGAQRLAVIVMPVLAMLAGAAVAAFARWRGQPVLAVAASGVVGPGTLALAYLIAGPGSPADNHQTAPYWGALVAIGAGALGSVAAAVARKPAPADETTTADGTAALEPTDILNPIRDGATTPKRAGTHAAGEPADQPTAPEPGKAGGSGARSSRPPKFRTSAAGARRGTTPTGTTRDGPPPAHRTTVTRARVARPTAPAVGFSVDPAVNPPTTEDFWPAGSAGPADRRGLTDRTDDRWDAFAVASRPRFTDRESPRPDPAPAVDDQPRPDRPGRPTDQPQPVNKPPAARANAVNAPPAAPASPVNPPPPAPRAPVNPPPAAPAAPVNPAPTAPQAPVDPPPTARRPAEAATPAEDAATKSGRTRGRADQDRPGRPRPPRGQGPERRADRRRTPGGPQRTGVRPVPHRPRTPPTRTTDTASTGTGFTAGPADYGRPGGRRGPGLPHRRRPSGPRARPISAEPESRGRRRAERAEPANPTRCRGRGDEPAPTVEPAPAVRPDGGQPDPITPSRHRGASWPDRSARSSRGCSAGSAESRPEPAGRRPPSRHRAGAGARRPPSRPRRHRRNRWPATVPTLTPRRSETAERRRQAETGPVPPQGRRARTRPTGSRRAAEASPATAETDDKRESRGRGKGDRGVPARDEEYVDWVSGLSAPPAPDERPETDQPRRSLRSPGRHHQE